MSIVYICLILFLVGCGSEQLVDYSSVQQESTYTEKEEVAMVDYTTVKSGRITDSLSGEYADMLNITLQSEDINKLLAVSSQFENNSKITLKKVLYKIELLDADNSIIDVWTVDTYRTIQTETGNKIKRIGDIDDALSSLEKKYGITKEILTRQPGPNYFYFMSNAKKAEFREIVETNFDNNHKCLLSSELVTALQERWSEIQIASEPNKNYTVKYVVTFYNSDGNVLYTFHIDNDKNVYTNAGYLISGTFMEEWISDVLETALKE